MNEKNFIMTNGTIATLKDFAETVKQSMEAHYGEGYRVEIHTVLKNNDCRMTSIVINDGQSNMAPSIYIDALYEAYQDGMTMQKVCREVIGLYERNRVRGDFDASRVMDFEKIQDKIFYKLVNVERNKEMLLSTPHVRIHDLALIFCILFDKDVRGTATITIRDNLMKIWNVDTDTLYEVASQNTPRLFPVEIQPMSSIIRDMLEQELGEDANEFFDMMPEDDSRFNMFVISNKIRVSGAATIFYQNVLRDFANLLNSDLIILPSSIHEQILIPWDETMNPKDLSDMVREVNCSQVLKEEQLSDNVYIFNRSTGRVEMM